MILSHKEDSGRIRVWAELSLFLRFCRKIKLLLTENFTCRDNGIYKSINEKVCTFQFLYKGYTITGTEEQKPKYYFPRKNKLNATYRCI